ncbi:MAG: hypothetical protein ABSE62_07955 [Chthoniobacteraceae bacterium]|jgi:hypothetical protein
MNNDPSGKSRIIATGLREPGVRPTQISWWCLLAGLFFVICGARLWLIHNFGVSMPYFDEWIVEGKLFKAYLEDQLSIGLFFQNLNEHHIVFSRVFLLVLFCANKQWDPVLFMVVQAPFNALGITLLVSKMGKLMSVHGRAALAGFAAALGIIPFGWQNALMGCEIHFYLFPLFGLLVTWLCWRYEALSPRWWLGALLAFANLFTMASGVFFTAATVCFLILGLVRESVRRQWRAIVGIAILSAIVACGLAMPMATAGKLDMPQPNFFEFLNALANVLSWPCTFHGAWCIVQAPLILLALLLLIQGAPLSDGRWFAVLIGAAFWIQAVATAARRFLVWDNSRYRDSWTMLSITLAACLYFLGKSKGRQRVLFLALVMLWSFVIAGGVLNNVFNLLPHEIMGEHARRLTMEYNVRGYLRTGDAAYLNGEIPSQRRDSLVKLLNSATIRKILPPGVFYPNPPLQPVQEDNSGGGFAPDGYPAGLPDLGMPVYGSYDKDKLLTKRGIALWFAVPKGTRQVEMQLAGSPNSRSFELKVKEGHMYREIVPPVVSPGLQWETISINLSPRTTLFGIDATQWPGFDWTAFSAPVISTRPAPARWAQDAAGCYAGLLALGLALMLGGAADSMGASTGRRVAAGA